MNRMIGRSLGAILGAALGWLGLMVAGHPGSPFLIALWAFPFAWVVGDDLVDRRLHPRILTRDRILAHLFLLCVGIVCLYFGKDWVYGTTNLEAYWFVIPLDALAPGMLGLVVLGAVFRVNIFLGGPFDMNRDSFEPPSVTPVRR